MVTVIWFCCFFQVYGPGVGVLAICKGAEIALAMATFLPQVQATVCINGTNAINGVPLRYRDLCIEPIVYKCECTRVTEEGVLELFHCVEDNHTEEHQRSILPLEKAQGKILFIVGEGDRNHNSKAFAMQSLKRLKKYGKTHCTILSYPGAGHLIEPPASPFCRCSSSPFIPGPVLWGGEAQAHAAAQVHSWQEIKTFLRLHLSPVQSSRL